MSARRGQISEGLLEAAASGTGPMEAVPTSKLEPSQLWSGFVERPSSVAQPDHSVEGRITLI